MTIRDAGDVVETAQRHVERLHLLTTVGITPAYMGSLTPYDVEMLGVVSGTMEDVANWVLADLLVWIEDKVLETWRGRDWHEERDRRWLELLAACGQEKELGTLLNMRATARAFPWARRRHSEILKFRHHRLLVPYVPDEQEHWLDMCEAGAWSSKKLEQELYWVRQTPIRGMGETRLGDAADLFRSLGLGFQRTDSHHATLSHGQHQVHIGVGDGGLMFTLERAG